MRGSCFNSQFFDSETSYSSVASEIMRGKWFSGRQVKIVSQNKHRVCCSSVDGVQVLVLTHNFLIRKTVITRLQMKMFVGCGYLEGK